MMNVWVAILTNAYEASQADEVWPTLQSLRMSAFDSRELKRAVRFGSIAEAEAAKRRTAGGW